jgi:hypothetical protein
MIKDPLTPTVLELIGKATGLCDKEAWNNIWLLISKSEHDNTDPDKAFLDDKGKSLFGFCSALSYDYAKRGCTLGIVGWTTADSGRDGKGDAPELFRQYKNLGGDDLMPYVAGCTKSKTACKKLIEKIHAIADDPKWIQAQFENLVTGDGYLAKAVGAWKKVGVEKPSALAIAVVFDTSLNLGYDGPDGGCTHLIKIATKGNEEKTLHDYCKWKAKVSGKNEYNDPPINGVNRGKMFLKLVEAKCFTLKNCDKELQEAMSWTMK